MKQLMLLLTTLLISANPASAWERFDQNEGYKNCVDTALREWLEQANWKYLNRVEKSPYKPLAHQRCNSPISHDHVNEINK